MSLQIANPTSPQIIALDPHRPLHIELVKAEDYPKIEQISINWVSIAKKKMNETNIPKEPDVHSMFSDSWYMASGISKIIRKNSREQKKSATIFVCKDTNGEIHGISTFPTEFIPEKRGRFTIHATMVTHPRNIRCKANLSETQRVEGVGRTFFYFYAQMIAQRGLDLDSVFFEPTDSSVPFYEKFGFKLDKYYNRMQKDFSSKL
jgi:hypothetical protein